MAKVLMIGAGGVATVAAFKIAQNAEVFTDFMIASRRKEKCDKIVADIHKAGYKMNIQTAQVDADDVEQRVSCTRQGQQTVVGQEEVILAVVVGNQDGFECGFTQQGSVGDDLLE